MRKAVCFFLLLWLFFCFCSGCSTRPAPANIAATTGPVAQFASRIVSGTGLQVTQLVTEPVSCLHDYSLSVRQMELIGSSDLVLISGAGLEAFMADALGNTPVTDCSQGLSLMPEDPHYWLNPVLCTEMVRNITSALSNQYPQYTAVFEANCQTLQEELTALNSLGQETLANLSCRKLTTFHDGFSYLAQAFDLEILAAIEEESGSEASAKALTEIIGLVREHQLPAVFTEVNGSNAAASVICQETGVASFPLDMAMTGDYFAAMKQNILTLHNALG